MGYQNTDRRNKDRDTGTQECKLLVWRKGHLLPPDFLRLLMALLAQVYAFIPLAFNKLTPTICGRRIIK